MFPAIFSENTAFAKVKKRAVWDTHTHAWLRAVWWTRTVTNVLLIRKSDSSKHIRPTALFLFFLQKLKWALEMITRCAFAARTVNVGHCHPFNCKFSWLSLMKMKLCSADSDDGATCCAPAQCWLLSMSPLPPRRLQDRSAPPALLMWLYTTNSRKRMALAQR